MSHTVLAVGTAAVTASGCVWYLPAIADLRAGEDRPRSTRTAAAACLVWWAALALAAALLPTVGDWRPAARIALAGLVAATLLRLRAARYHRAEQREERLRWSVLGTVAGPLRAVPLPARPDARALLAGLLALVALASLAAVAALFAVGG
ncbi:hypothetical protein ACWGB8_32650 [Kitasatospora sp. NPDC054939]